MEKQKDSENMAAWTSKGARQLARRDFIKLAGAAAVGLTLAACVPPATTAPTSAPGAASPTSAAPAQTIKFGKLSPVTGANALLGTQQVHGTQLAVDEVNAAGGIKSMGGAKLEMLSGDHQGKPDVGLKEAERLMDEGAVALIGTLSSAVALVTTQAAAKRGIPHIIDEGVSDDITSRGFNNIFRITYSSNFEAAQLVYWLQQFAAIGKAQLTNLAIMHEDSLFGTTIVDSFVRNLAGSGMKVVERIAYPSASTDLTTQIARLKASNPDALIHAGYLSDGILVAKAAQEQRLNFPLIGLGSVFSNPQFVKEVGKAAEYAIDLNLGVSLQKPQAAKMAEAYNAKYPQDGFNHHAVYSYVGVKVLADALERAASSDSVLLLRALRETRLEDHPLSQDLIIFDAKGENINAALLIFQVLNGKIEIVLPEKFATAKFVFPVPAWDKRV